MFRDKIVCCYLYVISKYGYPPPANQLEDYLREMKQLGFQSVELEGIHAENLLEVFGQREMIAGTLASLRLQVPYFCVVLPGLSSANRQVREQNLTLFEKGCEIARLFGAQGVLDNAPLPPYQFPQNLPIVRHYDAEVLLSAHLPANLEWKKYWSGLVATYQQACDVAAEKKLTYQMHPCLGVLAANTDAYLYFHEAVSRENLRFNLDTANQFVMKDNLTLSLIRLAGLIDYIHLSDNRGSRVEHLVPGSGNIFWPAFFETLEKINFQGHIGIDVGGEESGLVNIDFSYVQAAEWLEQHWQPNI